MRERGFFLVHALFLLILAAALSAVLLTRSRGLAAATAHDRVELRAVYAAEGGLAKARHALARDPAYAGETLRIGACTVTITVERGGAATRIAAVARPGGVRREAALPR